MNNPETLATLNVFREKPLYEVDLPHTIKGTSRREEEHSLYP
jgi:hypothetical protein